MKTMNFKMYPIMAIASALLVLSGCDGTTGTVSDSGIGTEITVPDAGTSTVTANPGTILADGVETSTITVTVNDASSNPITDATVTLSQSGTSTISNVTNVGDGTYTFDVNSTTAETVTYTATADGVTITQTVDVVFSQTEAQCLEAAGYGTITINGKTWLDRNLGASAISGNGDLYQWGRSAEGHQLRDSNTTATLATSLNDDNTTTDWYGNFIIVDNSSEPRDWVDATVDDDGSLRSQSWSTPTNPNQVCPCGYIVPSEQDFVDLNITNDSNASDTFNLAYAGWRDFRLVNDGQINEVGTAAFFWTNEVKSGNTNRSVAYSYTTTSETSHADSIRPYGHSIRCIKP